MLDRWWQICVIPGLRGVQGKSKSNEILSGGDLAVAHTVCHIWMILRNLENQLQLTAHYTFLREATICSSGCNMLMEAIMVLSNLISKMNIKIHTRSESYLKYYIFTSICCVFLKYIYVMLSSLFCDGCKNFLCKLERRIKARLYWWCLLTGKRANKTFLWNLVLPRLILQ